MKKLYTLLALVITLITFAQAPQGFNYQATVRNSAGALIVNQNVFFKFNLMLNSASSLPVFSETHMTPTDDLGQVNLVIGTGTATTGTFSSINWGSGNYYLGIELNTGSGYVAMGTTQLLSVPYALYANSSGNAQTPTPNLASVLAVNNGANNLKITNLANPTDAQDAATKNYVDNATSNNTTLTDGSVFVGNASNVATAVALSGDVTLTNTGVATITNNAVTTSKITDVNVTNAKLDKANIPLSGFGAATADVNLGTKKLTNVADPTTAQDAATKNYVDTEIANIQISSQGKTSIYLTGNITDAQAAAKITAELGPYTENIYIRNTTQLTTVDLSALVTISNITIANNSNLANINLSNLSSIEDEFYFRDNASLSSLSFPALLNCSDFQMNPGGAFTSLNLPVLSYINSFSISEWTGTNSNLTSLNFPAVQTIGGSFNLSGLNSLTTLTFPMLSTLNGSISIQPANNASLNITNLSFPALTSCTGFYHSSMPSGNNSFTQGYIYIINNAQASINLSSLASCNSISISGVSSLNLSSLASCNDITIISTLLTSLSFPSLTNNSNINLSGNALTSNSVNSLLNKFLTVAPASGKNINLEGQTPPAPPTGQGLIDKQTLITAGNQVYTDGFLPTITTTAVSAITSSSATSGGTITNDGGGTIQGSGIVWATTTNPTTGNNFLYNGASNFTSNLTGLSPGTTYYVRAFATTSSGTAYGNEISFSTLSLLPTLTTTEATSITFSSATSGGNITSSGGNVTARGVCWSTSANPTIALTTKTVDGTGNGIFTSNLTGLAPVTTYYLRAYATNSAGTEYGQEVVFITLATLPTLTTTEASEITSSTASSGGAILSDGGGSITARGIVWSTTTNPTTTTNQGIISNGTGIGIYTSSISLLTYGTLYYVRAYATNSVGTAYGNQITFSTVAAIPTITNGTQYWQTTNLDVTTYRDGTPIPQVTDPIAWGALTTGAWCYYNNTTANGTTYGKLYNWYAVAGIHDNDPNTPNKILAPSGWHIPTDAEWTTLITYLGGQSVAGGKMKSTGTSLWSAPNTEATNSSSFNGFPGGCRYEYGAFLDIGTDGLWWSLSEFDTSLEDLGPAYYRGLNNSNGGINRNYYNKQGGFSVRCVRD
jgi:uncharacterized protein (TIGR02145 family)